MLAALESFLNKTKDETGGGLIDFPKERKAGARAQRVAITAINSRYHRAHNPVSQGIAEPTADDVTQGGIFRNGTLAKEWLGDEAQLLAGAEQRRGDRFHEGGRDLPPETGIHNLTALCFRAGRDHFEIVAKVFKETFEEGMAHKKIERPLLEEEPLTGVCLRTASRFRFPFEEKDITACPVKVMGER
jgi:hypothetical protein